jgi:hypothetical protein
LTEPGRSRRRWNAAILVTLAAALLACRSQADVRLEHAFSDSHGGVAVRFPRGWRITTTNTTPVDNPALCFTLLRGRGPTVPEVKLVEYLPPLLDPSALTDPMPLTGKLEFPHRAKHFRLSILRRGDNNWTTGRTAAFQAHGRAFFVGVRLSPDATRPVRDEVVAILDSLRIRAGKCTPSGNR